eukprot:12404460-Karenia_brevis.AAC.1
MTNLEPPVLWASVTRNLLEKLRTVPGIIAGEPISVCDAPDVSSSFRIPAAATLQKPRLH